MDLKVENLSRPVDKNAHNIFMPKILRQWQSDIPETDNTDRFIEKFFKISDCVPYEQYDETLALERVKSAQRIFNHLRNSYCKLLENEI